MKYFAGIDVSLEESSISVVDASGKIVREVKVASEPEALVEFFGKAGFVVTRRRSRPSDRGPMDTLRGRQPKCRYRLASKPAHRAQSWIQRHPSPIPMITPLCAVLTQPSRVSTHTNKQRPEDRRLPTGYRWMTADQAARLRLMKPRPARPMPNTASVPGSGAVATNSESKDVIW